MKLSRAALLCISSLLAKVVTGVCHCPYVCENCGWPGDWNEEYGRALCNDVESQSECQKANWEIADMQSSLSTLVSHLLDDALETKNMTTLQVGFARSLLSLALEDEKPEGDCSAGLATETGLAGTLSHCFSPQLLLQCAKVRDAVDDYQDGIAPKLRKLLRSRDLLYSDDPEVTYDERSFELGLTDEDSVITNEKMLELIEIIRFRTRIRTARIRCASFNMTTLRLQSSAVGIMPLSSMIMVLMAATGLFVYF